VFLLVSLRKLTHSGHLIVRYAAAETHQCGVSTQARGWSDALLRELLFDAAGTKMHPIYTRKKGREYRYYISNAEMRFGAAAKTCG
jgi:hypothetical protein